MSMKTCPICGKNHEKRSPYCSTKCGQRAWQKKNYKPVPYIWRTCAYPGCKKGEDGKPKKFKTNRTHARCCGKSCGVMLYNLEHPEKTKKWMETYIKKKAEAIKKEI